MIFWLGIMQLQADEVEMAEMSIHGDVKTFFIAGFPEEHILQPMSDFGQSFVDGRLKLRWKINQNVYVDAHHAITMGTAAPQTQMEVELGNLGVEVEGGTNVMMTGVGLQAPELMKLSWTGEDSDLFLQGRTDRFYVQASVGSVDIRLGRQPISFGHGMLFNPMDLVQPFSFATIDSEYKPGVDAMRVDGYIGMSSQITGALVYAGDWESDGLIAIINGNTTVGWTDISAFYGMVRGDQVLGTGFVSSIGSVGIHADVTYTMPEQEDPFVRTVLGWMWKPYERATLNGELYMQTLGAESVDDYFTFASSERFARGELWLLGRYYGSLSFSQEVTPLVFANISVITNFMDSSAMITPSLQVSVSDEVQLNLGGYIGLGEAPDEITLTELLLGEDMSINSEFGMLSKTAFLQCKMYF
jgi:hypothetical protein